MRLPAFERAVPLGSFKPKAGCRCKIELKQKGPEKSGHGIFSASYFFLAASLSASALALDLSKKVLKVLASSSGWNLGM